MNKLLEQYAKLDQSKYPNSETKWNRMTCRERFNEIVGGIWTDRTCLKLSKLQWGQIPIKQQGYIARRLYDKGGNL